MNVGGGYNQNPSAYYRYEWSIGEAAAIETFKSSTLVVTAGVLQPATDNPAAKNNDEEWGTEEIRIFPNPVVTELDVSFLSKQQGKVSMALYDASGKLIGKKQFDYYGIGYISKWLFTPYASGEYIMRIILDPLPGFTGKKGTFKIQKLNK